MERLSIQPNTSDSSTSKSDSSFETENIQSQRNRRKSFYSWCAPRKTKTVSSTGEIFIDLTSNPKVKKRKCRIRAKTEKIHSKVFQRQKRINELARPRQMVLKSAEKSQHNIKVISNKVLQSQNRMNDLSRRKQVIFESFQNSPQSNKDTKFTSNSNLSLTNFGINEKTTNPRTISRQEWMERINKLAEPRVREPTPTNIIGKVAEKALHATASKRIKELAMRKPPTSLDPQKKDGDPFKVNPQALKAICSMRIKSLATPKIFKIHSHYSMTKK